MASETDVLDTGWQAQALRLTLFLSAPLELGVAATLWQTAGGAIQKSTITARAKAFGGRPAHLRIGISETLIAPARVDWVLAPKSTTASACSAVFREPR